VEIVEFAQGDHRCPEGHLKAIFRGKPEPWLLRVGYPERGCAANRMQRPDEAIQRVYNSGGEIGV
jgi:hypothetical protein